MRLSPTSLAAASAVVGSVVSCGAFGETDASNESPESSRDGVTSPSTERDGAFESNEAGGHPPDFCDGYPVICDDFERAVPEAPPWSRVVRGAGEVATGDGATPGRPGRVLAVTIPERDEETGWATLRAQLPRSFEVIRFSMRVPTTSSEEGTSLIEVSCEDSELELALDREGIYADVVIDGEETTRAKVAERAAVDGWHEYTIEQDASSLRILLDGAERASSLPRVTGACEISVGLWGSDTGPEMSVHYDDVRVR